MEWATPKEQSVHAAKKLLANCGENHYGAKYTNEEVKNMRGLYENGICDVKELAEMFNEKINNIKRILNYERWKYI